MLLGSPFSHRRHLLRTLLPPLNDTSDLSSARFDHIESLDSTDCTDVRTEMQAFFADVVQQKCEGLMIKLLESGEVVGGEDEDLSELEEDGGEDVKPKKKSGKAATAAATAKAAEAAKNGTKKPRPSTYEPDQRTMGWLKLKKGQSQHRIRAFVEDGTDWNRLPRRPWRQSGSGSHRGMVGVRAKGRMVVAYPSGMPQPRDRRARGRLQMCVILWHRSKKTDRLRRHIRLFR